MRSRPSLVGQHALHVTFVIELLGEHGGDLDESRLRLVLDEGVVVGGGRHLGPLKLLLGLADLELQPLPLDGTHALELLEFGTQVVDTLGEDQNSLLNFGINNLVEFVLALLLLGFLRCLGFLGCLGLLFLDWSVTSFLLHLFLYLLGGPSRSSRSSADMALLGGSALDAVFLLVDIVVDLGRSLLGLRRLAHLANEVDGGDDTASL